MGNWERERQKLRSPYNLVRPRNFLVPSGVSSIMGTGGPPQGSFWREICKSLNCRLNRALFRCTVKIPRELNRHTWIRWKPRWSLFSCVDKIVSLNGPISSIRICYYQVRLNFRRHRSQCWEATRNNILLMPTIEVGVECLFNYTRNIYHYMRGSLKPLTI